MNDSSNKGAINNSPINRKVSKRKEYFEKKIKVMKNKNEKL